MQNLEEKVVATFEIQPLVWARYVDDIFILWDHDQSELQQLLDSITAKFPHIKFTVNVESEIDQSIVFLDVVIVRSNEGFKTKIYHKSTGNPAIIPFRSHTYGSHKAAAFRTYVRRAYSYCTDKRDIKTEMIFIQNLAKKFGYPESFVNKIERQFLSPKLPISTSLEEKPKFVGSLQFSKVSVKIARIFEKYRYKLAFRPVPSVYTRLRKDRDSTPKLQSAGIYHIPISVDNTIVSSYIGSTKRNITKRISEHIRDVNNIHKLRPREVENSTALVQYLRQFPGHNPDWIAVRKIGSTDRPKKLKALESAYIST